MHWTAIEPGVTNWPDSHKPHVTNLLVTAIGMCGYTPVRITGVLVYIFLLITEFQLLFGPKCDYTVDNDSLLALVFA